MGKATTKRSGGRKEASEASTETARFWKDSPEIIRGFLDRRADYEQLANEVAYILKKRLKKGEIEVSTVTLRAKTLNSFLEKIARKKFRDPFAEITDFAGVRVTCLYLDDIPLIENIVRDEFEVVERVDKLSDRDADQFGYGAVHYIVRLGGGSSGARYDDLRDYVCEVQVRTVLQDAWAIIDHHLVYKKESAVPKTLQRKLNSLAGLFETADDQFQRIREDREQYLREVADSQKTEDTFLANEVNLDSVRQYLEWKFPEKPVALSGEFNQLSAVFEDILPDEYRTLHDIDSLIEEEREHVAAVFKDADLEFAKIDGQIPSCMNLGISLALRRPEILLEYSEKTADVVRAIIES